MSFVDVIDVRQVIVARPEHPLALTQGIVDLQLLAPHVVNEIREWFRTYKTFEGKGLNEFGFGGRCLTSAEAAEVFALPFFLLHFGTVLLSDAQALEIFTADAYSNAGQVIAETQDDWAELALGKVSAKDYWIGPK